MQKLHDNLCNVSTWYRKWHEHPSYGTYHWIIFLLLVFVTLSRSASNIEVAYDSVNDINGQIELKAAITNVKRSDFAGQKGQKYAEDRILVKFKSNVSESDSEAILHRRNLSKKDEIKQIGLKIINVPNGNTPEEVIQRLIADDQASLEFAELDRVVEPAFTPNDPYLPNEWHIFDISAPVAWDTTQGSSNIVVAILDTGTDCTHPDLATHCVPGWNTYDNNSNTSDVYGHGTKTAGTAAAIGNNTIGVSGVAPQVLIMPIRISSLSGLGYDSTIASGLTWAADHGARVANISYQVSGFSGVDSAAKYFQSKGGIVTVSAGNSSTVLTSPNDPYVLTISGVSSGNVMASWSNTGSNIDFAAPGAGIYTTTSGGGYGSVSGTSFSAPITAGVAALVLSANPRLTSSQLEQIMKQNADDLGSPGWDPKYGYGLINAAKAVAAAGTPVVDSLAPTTPSNLVATAPDSSRVLLSWTASSDNVGVAGYKISKNGTVIATVTSLSYTDIAVTPSSSYSYNVQAFDSSGNLSGQSNTTLVTIPKSSVAITSFKVLTKTGTTASINWITNIASTGKVVYGTSASNLNMTLSDSNIGTSHTVSIGGLSKSTKYYYAIQAVASDSSSSANSIVSNFRTRSK